MSSRLSKPLISPRSTMGSWFTRRLVSTVNDGANDAAAVERERGHEVEQREHEVYRSEPEHQRGAGAEPANRRERVGAEHALACQRDARERDAEAAD